MAYDGRRQPGEWVLRQAARRGRVIALSLIVWFGVGGVALALALQHRLTYLDAILVAALALALRPQIERYIEVHGRWLAGGRAEETVGRTLEELRREGWIVMHDLTPDGRGNLDHVVSGPNGVFLVETKLRSYSEANLSRVKGQAARLHDALGVWVTPVICLHERTGGAFAAKGVEVVPRACSWSGSGHNGTSLSSSSASLAS